jgi:hypothetical protein
MMFMAMALVWGDCWGLFIKLVELRDRTPVRIGLHFMLVIEFHPTNDACLVG